MFSVYPACPFRATGISEHGEGYSLNVTKEHYNKTSRQSLADPYQMILDTWEHLSSNQSVASLVTSDPPLMQEELCMGYISWGGGAAVPESPILCTVSLHAASALLPPPSPLYQTPFMYPNVILYVGPLAMPLCFCFHHPHSQQFLVQPNTTFWPCVFGHATNALLCPPPADPQGALVDPQVVLTSPAPSVLPLMPHVLVERLPCAC